MLTVKDLDTLIETAIESLDDSYEYYGLRFEDTDRSIGDTLGKSRHNPDREDDREFPAYGSPDYDDLPELDGASAWQIGDYDDNWKYSYWSKDQRRMGLGANGCPPCEHAYIVASNYESTHSDADPNEIVLVDAVVVAKLY